jgi:hypothetical protein
MQLGQGEGAHSVFSLNPAVTPFEAGQPDNRASAQGVPQCTVSVPRNPKCLQSSLFQSGAGRALSLQI